VLPKSKPLLASAIALEWSHLRTSADATKSHRIPLTQMSARAIDMAAAEATGDRSIRAATIKNLIRYLDTDTVLCWAPTAPEHLRDPGRPQLRDLQIAAATPIMDYLSSRVWPGLEIRPVDGDKGIIGPGQPRETREALISWLDQLDTWALVGFERIVHATKSFVLAARMVAEWRGPGEQQWGVEEAAKAASIEVKYQTQQWGEVEDTHDVEKEDVKRQVGAGWLMIVGEV
jgi:chaperone required for assembly of F1-ATPase